MEFEFGFGYVNSSETNLFNDKQGVDPGGGFALNMALRYHHDYNWSFGIHFLGAFDAVSEFDEDVVLGYPTDGTLSMSNINLGVNSKFTQNLGIWQPYISLGLGAVLGSLSVIEYEEPANEFTGIALDMGIGLGYMATNELMISTTLRRNLGLAWWKYLPSEESINNEFNPGYWSLTLNANWFFGG